MAESLNWTSRTVGGDKSCMWSSNPFVLLEPAIIMFAGLIQCMP